MLVLSRRVTDSISFPELDISIEILQIKGSTVRVGVNAPLEINVLRGELSQKDKQITKKILVSAEDDHALRNKLNSLTVATAMARKLLSRGETNLAASTLNDALVTIDEYQLQSCAQALLVEDAPNEREMLAGFLRLHGFRVNTAKDGIEAIEFLEENKKPDFILMDMRLPRLDGASTIRRIRENPSFDDIEIFAISGQTPRLAGIDVDETRIARWFQKPLQPANLVTAINSHINALSEAW